MSIILTLSVLAIWLTFAAAFCAVGGLLFDRLGRVEPSWEHPGVLAVAWDNVEMLPAEPVFAHTARQTKSGLTIDVSKSASFRTPIPNTRYFNPYLELRTPDDLRSGFRNRANAPLGYGYEVEYVMQPNAGTEIVVPAGE